jgi:hypothetical protein
MKITKITITTEWVDEETGEVFKDTREMKDDSIKKPRATTSKASSKSDDRKELILTLEDNKYILSAGAVAALGVEAGDKIDIKFQKVDNKMIPVIGTNDTFGTKAGNKLTKSNTVSYRGKSNDELKIYGDIFTLVEHPTAVGLFILKGENTPDVDMVTTKVAQPEEETEVEEDASDLLEGEDTEEVTTKDFDFTL